MLAKCGTIMVHHWAHKGIRVCDEWWERELAWHRNWKNNFPLEWQESIRFAADGEKHIADVRTDAGLVIEFQHSALNPAERQARESFYGNMVWVVDGTRLKRDIPRFLEFKDLLRSTGSAGIYTCHAPQLVFPKNWVASSVCVFFDFGKLTDEPDVLWGILPYRVGEDAVVVAMPRPQFVKRALEHSEVLPARSIAENVASMMRSAAMRQAQIQRHRAATSLLQLMQHRYSAPRGRRRF